jgi:fermentation-respiration switch protein FrsA (DUF1100 family)
MDLSDQANRVPTQARSARRAWRGRVLRVAGSIAGVYLVILGLLMAFEEALVFPGPKYPVGDWTPVGLNQEEVFFAAADGVQLHGWYVAPPQPRAYILFCHGNGENVGYLGPYLEYLRDELNVAVFAFDYRGYGRSAGKPNEQGIIADGLAAQAWLAKRAGAAPHDLVLWGRSLGGGVAVELAAQNGARGLIVERTFTSLPDVAAVHYAWAPVRLMMRTRLDSFSRINEYRGPLLQSHGTADSIIPFSIGRRLFDAYEGEKEFLSLEGGDHNDPPADEWHAAIDRFLERIASNRE